MSAASKTNHENPDLGVVVFERGEWVSYAACGMPYYVKGEVEALEDLVQVTPAEFREERDVDLHLDTAVEGFPGHYEGGVKAVDLEDGGQVPADVVIVGVGVAPNTELAADAGIEVGETGAIAVHEYGRTSAEDVWAAGDCAEATNVVTGEPDDVPLALTANRAGRAIGESVATGGLQETGPIAGTAIVKGFDLDASRTGIVDEERAREAGFDPVSVEIQATSRAHYYPGDEQLTVKLVADGESEEVLGGSIVGKEGAKRIDTIATALYEGLTVHEVEALDLAYAPPFSPVWDPVLTAAKVLGGKLE